MPLEDGGLTVPLLPPPQPETCSSKKSTRHAAGIEKATRKPRFRNPRGRPYRQYSHPYLKIQIKLGVIQRARNSGRRFIDRKVFIRSSADLGRRIFRIPSHRQQRNSTRTSSQSPRRFGSSRPSHGERQNSPYRTTTSGVRMTSKARRVSSKEVVIRVEQGLWPCVKHLN